MKNNSLTVIGAANADLYGMPFKKLIFKTSNPGTINVGFGGVARNIAENLSRLGLGVELLSVLGDDLYGDKILEHSKKIGMNVDNVLISAESSTATYFAVLNDNQDMEIAIIDMKIIAELDQSFIEQRQEVIKANPVCILDAGMPKETIDFILESYPDKKFYLDPVSYTHAKKVINNIGRFYAIKPNRIEAEVITGVTINNKDDLIRASSILLEKGVKKVFISLANDGVFYNDGKSSGKLRAADIVPTNAVGAGDAFMAAMIFGDLNGMSMEEVTRFATAASIVTMENDTAVNPAISVTAIQNKMSELNYV